MSHDDFDDEMSKLYQQRKAQTIVPNISLDKPAKRRKLSPLSIFAIFSSAGIASFGIIAVISHFSSSPVKKATFNNIKHNVVMADATLKTTDESDQSINIVQPIPPKPLVNKAEKSPILLAEKEAIHEYIEPNAMAAPMIKIVTLPQLKEPELAIQPIYKILPQYPANSLKDMQSGEIQLRYQILQDGTVSNINIVKSSVNKLLQQSAKKALAKWQYAPSDNFKENYEIIFEFTMIKN